MPKVRGVVVLPVLILAALVTAGTAAVGLYRAAQLWNELVNAPGCPRAPRAAVAAPAAHAAPAPVTRDEPKRGIQISALSVREDAAEIDAGGRRHELPGYPPPSSKDHKQGRLTTAVVAPDGRLVAVAGECNGQSGMGDAERFPSCVATFVRLYRVTDGTRVRDLKTRWRIGTDDEQRVLAMAFDQHADRLAVVVRTSWSDCSWNGDAVELLVYRLADGARVAHRVLAFEDEGGTRSIAFHEGEVHVLTARGHAPAKVDVVRLQKPKAT